METWLDGDRSIAALEAFAPWTAIIAVALLVADIVIPLPASGVMAALGVLYGPITGGMLGAGGNFLSGLLAFAVCRRYGQPAARWFLGADDYTRAVRRFSQIGALSVAGSRALPLVPEVTACLAGLLDMPWRRFVPALAAGAMITGMGFAALGHWGRDAPVLMMAVAVLAPPLALVIAGYPIRSR